MPAWRPWDPSKGEGVCSVVGCLRRVERNRRLCLPCRRELMRAYRRAWDRARYWARKLDGVERPSRRRPRRA